jgi:hypothetical protein
VVWSVVECCCVVLSVVAWRWLLLRVAVCCCVLLCVVACCCVLLRVAECCCDLPSVVFRSLICIFKFFSEHI